MYRATGSISIIGKSRLAFLVAPDKLDPNLRVLAQVKANSSAKTDAIGYRVVPHNVTDGGKLMAHTAAENDFQALSFLRDG